MIINNSSLKSSLLVFLVAILPAMAMAQVSVGSASYTTTFPGVDQAGRNKFPSGTPQVTGNAAGKPVPTNDWWSKLIKDNHADNLFNYPMTMSTKNNGLIITYIPWGPIGDNAAVVAGVTGLNVSNTTVSDYGDWTVTMNWNDGSHDLKATSGIGMPFVYFEKGASDLAEVRINSGSVTVIDEMIVVENASNGADFAIYGPVGSTWTQNGTTYTSTLNNKNYWSIAMLPQSTSNVSSKATAYKKYAYVFPSGTTTTWNYNETTGKVSSTYTVTTDVKEGSETNVLMGLLPHQWNNLASGSATPGGDTYSSVRGDLKMLDGNSFTLENTFKGILPTLPNLTQYSTGYSPALLDSKISLIENDQLATWTDSYNEGQVMNRLIQTARIADQMGNTEARDKMIATVKERLEDWLTYQNGEVAFLFYYNSDWSAMIGYPAGHGQDENINDHHFHWGYFIHAAAFLEQYQPGWAANWGDMINLLIRDAASNDRNDTQFPFLRNFSPYAGHSWANGFASFPQGNDQESTSESMQFASALIHWGTITENNAIRDLGIYIYTTEQTAIEEYWFDMYNRNFDVNHPYSLVSRVWGNSYDNGTFWTSDIAASYGIELYPIHGGSLYLGHNQTYAANLWTEMAANTGILSNQENPNLWHDTYWKFLSMTDADAAISLYDSYPNRNLKFGISDAQTYHWLHAINATGPVNANITANYPIAVAFEENGVKTYVAHNYSDAQKTVSFSDGFDLVVPANSMATNRDVNASGTLSSDVSEISAGETVNFTAVTTGSGITKVEFYNGDTLLGTDTTAPYEHASSSLPLGLHNIYAKVYINTDFVNSNVLTIQVGNQIPFTSNHAIPGTIEAGHFDGFEGGVGQNVSYYDSSVVNEGGFRPNEYVDALTVTNEGATVGWITAGEWIEYTIDVQSTGCYDVSFRYASGNNAGGGPFYFEEDGQKVSPDIPVSSTGDWNSWNTQNTNVELTAGTHVLRFVATQGEFNLGRMTFTYSGAQCSSSAEIGFPFDFETSPVTNDFVNFDGGTATVVDVTGLQATGNSSAKMARIVRDGGQPWSGAYLNLNAPLNFTTDKYITFKLWTEAPIGTTVQLKLERQSAGGSAEIPLTTTKSSEWEEFYFDFSAQGVSTYDRLVFMFDLGNVGDGTAASTFYFDDVNQVGTLSTNQVQLEQVSLYPNPVTHLLNIDAKTVNIDKVEIYSLLGQRVLEVTDNVKTVSVANLNRGMYIVRLYAGKAFVTKKLIKR